MTRWGVFGFPYKHASDNGWYLQTFSYDLAGRPTQITYPDSSNSVASYAYTNGGNLSTLSLNGTVAATWSNFTASGLPQNVAYHNGVGTTYGYDAVNHLTALSTTNSAGTPLQNLNYDWYTNTNGMNIHSIADKRPNTVVNGVNTDETQTYTYDSLYRLTQATGMWGANGTQVTKAYTYDAFGNVQTFGGVVNRDFSSQTSYVGQQLVSGTQLSASYDAAGNMTQKTLDGISWTYNWSAENRLTSAFSNQGAFALMSYDTNGQRALKWSHVSTGPTVITTYIGDLYEKRTYTDGTAMRQTLHLFANGQRIASVTPPVGTKATAFNTANQWRSEVAMASLYDGGSVTGLANKTFHLLKAAVLHPHAVRWFILALFGAFAAWILAQLASSLSFKDGRLRLYAARMRIVAASILLVFSFTIFSCNGTGIGAISRDQNYLINNTNLGPAVGTYYYHTNHINSSSVITDAKGNEVTRMVYLPFGEISQANSTENDTVTYKFTGQEFDEESGLYYYGSRYYDPAIGRFLSADTIIPNIRDTQAFNRYSYVRNNPIIYTDPRGHDPEPEEPTEESPPDNPPPPSDDIDIGIGTGDDVLGGADTGNPSDPIGNGTTQSSPYDSVSIQTTETKTDPSGQSLDNMANQSVAVPNEETKPVGAAQDPMSQIVPDGPTSLEAKILQIEVLNASYNEGTRVHDPMLDLANWLINNHVDYIAGGIGLLALGIAIGLAAGPAIYEMLAPAAPIIAENSAPMQERGAATLESATTQGITVIGHYPEYVKMGEELGANIFQVPMDIWKTMSPAEQWAANQHFLDEAVTRGDIFRLATPLEEMRLGSGFYQEVNYLMSLGYTPTANGTALIKGGP